MQTLLPYYYLDVVRDDAVFTVEGLQVGGRRTIPLETIITELDEIAVQFLLQSPLIRSESPSRFFCYYDAQILLGIEDEWTNICLDRYAFASLNGIIKKGDAR